MRIKTKTEMTIGRNSRISRIAMVWLGVLAISAVSATDLLDQEIKNFHDEMMEELEHSHSLNAEHL